MKILSTITRAEALAKLKTRDDLRRQIKALVGELDRQTVGVQPLSQVISERLLSHYLDDVNLTRSGKIYTTDPEHPQYQPPPARVGDAY